MFTAINTLQMLIYDNLSLLTNINRWQEGKNRSDHPLLSSQNKIWLPKNVAKLLESSSTVTKVLQVNHTKFHKYDIVVR